MALTPGEAGEVALLGRGQDRFKWSQSWSWISGTPQGEKPVCLGM